MRFDFINFFTIKISKIPNRKRLSEKELEEIINNSENCKISDDIS